jgi:hypothetical protein
MKYGISTLALVFILTAVPTFAFESRDSERTERRLRIELEAVPSPVQQNFDRYVDELAAAARRDALNGEQTRKQDEARNREAKALNPIVLFRW